jgi:anti-sigma factor ChrR (cupin superfamily)
MTPTGPRDPEHEETAAMAALGFLSPRDEAKAARELVDEFRESASLVADAVRPVAPSPTLKHRLMARVASHEQLKPVADVRSFDGGWKFSGVPGVDVKTLFTDSTAGRTTVLLRMQPGSSFPSHHHHDEEQCLVLEGDVRWGDLVYEKGDFVVAGRDTTHPVTHTVNGNLLLIVAGHNEFVHA